MGIRTRQIQDGAITNPKIAAGAGIETSKLAEGGDFIRRTGSLAFTGNQPMGGFLLTGHGTPSAGTDVTNKAYVDGLIANLNSVFTAKDSVIAATTANVALTGAQTIDGIALTSGQRVLVKNQTAPAENGIYLVAVGAWTRTTDFDLWDEIPGGLVPVEQGTVNADSVWLSTANSGGTLGTTAITWQTIGATAGLSNSNFVDQETPAGLINGSNTTYTLANTPVVGSVHLYINGLLGLVGTDYNISGATITMLDVMVAGEWLRATYRK